MDTNDKYDERTKPFLDRDIVKIVKIALAVISVFFGGGISVYIFSSSQTFIIDGNEVRVERSEIREVYENNQRLEDENARLMLENNRLTDDITTMQRQAEGVVIASGEMYDENIRLRDENIYLQLENSRLEDVVESLNYILQRRTTNTINVSDTQLQLPSNEPFLRAAPWYERYQTIRTGTAYMLGNSYLNSIFGTGWSHHNLNMEYSTIRGVIGRGDGSGTSTSSINFIGDGVKLATFSVDGDTIPYEISVDVTGVRVLRIQINDIGRRSAYIVFANAMIYRTS